ncbi:YaaR family protein [Olavius algarvensis spirochete endosymbiont]|uniref:YaaR family protein n=1 Tax=Olavius algarvensis spirochete endosymbiont TaxID=260710 RepID=UPI00068FF25D|nr:YaaR family protein [Olavius algarvensis spirochete endosymbiont]
MKKKRGSERSKTAKGSFSSAVEKATRDSRLTSVGLLPELDGTESIEELLDDVHQAGDELIKDPVFGPLSEYKKAVRRFLRYILEYSLEVEEITGSRNSKTMQQKKYLIVRVVDEKLESLASHVIKNQAGQLEILRRINEIHGMLVDLSG